MIFRVRNHNHTYPKTPGTELHTHGTYLYISNT